MIFLLNTHKTTQFFIPMVKKCLVEHVNDNYLRHVEHPARIAKAWLVLAMFGSDDMYDLPLEGENDLFCVQRKSMGIIMYSPLISVLLRVFSGSG